MCRDRALIPPPPSLPRACPGCGQVAYIVIANRMLKHYGDDAIPALRQNWPGLVELMQWFNRHADPIDGLYANFAIVWVPIPPNFSQSGSQRSAIPRAA